MYEFSSMFQDILINSKQQQQQQSGPKESI